MPRKHRRVHHPRTDCRCPEGAKPVPTKKGRSFGCVANVLPPGGKKPVPRFVKLVCGPEAGEVKQWKPPPGQKRKQRRPKKDVVVLVVPEEQAARTAHVFPEQFRIPFRRSDDDLPLLKLLSNKQRAALRPFLSPEEQEQMPLFNNRKRQIHLLNNNRKTEPPASGEKPPSWWGWRQ